MSALRGEDVEIHIIYFLFDFPNISRTWAGVRNHTILYSLIDWDKFKRSLKQHAYDNYPGLIRCEFVIFINRRTSRESRNRIKSLRKSGFRVVVKRKETQESDIDEDIVNFVDLAVRNPITTAIYVLGNDLKNALLIASNIIAPECYNADAKFYHQNDLWLGVIPSAFTPNTHLDRFPFNTQIIDLEKLPGVLERVEDKHEITSHRK